MPIVAPVSAVPAGATTTAGVVLEDVASDMLQEVGEENPVLLDYVDRVQREILRTSNWTFLVAPQARFITELEQTDYWVGTIGRGPDTAVETELNLQYYGKIKKDSVLDRSNFVQLQPVAFAPLSGKLTYKDALYRPGRPKGFKAYLDNPGLISIYPAPDNQNNFQPMPPSPLVTSIIGGALLARTYYVKVTYVDSTGLESLPSSETTQYIPAGELAQIAAPPIGILKTTRGISYGFYNVYASTTAGGETRQSLAPVDTTLPWTEPGTGLIAGANIPTTSTITPLDGYIIEFEYYLFRQKISSTAQIIQIPDDYLDVVVAGVNWYTARLLMAGNSSRVKDMQFWMGVYKDGLRQIVRDKNLFPQGPGDYMHPDGAGIGSTYWDAGAYPLP